MRAHDRLWRRAARWQAPQSGCPLLPCSLRHGHLLKLLALGIRGELVPAAVAAAVEDAWAEASPRTWNRHLSALGSFVAFCRRRGWPVRDLVTGLDRRREKTDNSRVLSFLELERLWSRESIGLRERCLWRLLYETAARADQVLSLNVRGRRCRQQARGGRLQGQ